MTILLQSIPNIIDIKKPGEVLHQAFLSDVGIKID
jgi:hypothetical protein